MVFWIIGGVGVALILIALVFGEILDGLLPSVDLDSGGSLFSTEVVGSFLAAFGFGTALLSGPFGVALGSLGGLSAGLALGWLTLRFSRSVMNMRTDPTPRTSDLVGSLGTVVTRIPDSGLGEISVVAHGQRVKLNARADAALPAGTDVVVVDVTSPTSVIVTEADF
ncbi:MAG: NfeD family protein [Egibacteraceae bacterium]